jgi:O-antigen/teichoic acid export membrane protein
MFGMNREVPYYRGAGNKDKEKDILSSAFWANLVFLFTISLFIITSSYFMRSYAIIDERYCDILFFSGLIIITNRLCQYYEIKLKLDKKVTLLSLLDLYGRIFGIVTCIILTYFFKLRGFFTGILIGDVTLLLLYYKADKNIPAFKISFHVIKELIKVGFPIMAVGVMSMLLGNTDKLMILKYFSEESLGFYGISSFIAMILGMIPGKLYQVTMPYIMEAYGKTKDIHKIKNYFIEPTVLLSYISPFIISAIFFSIHIPIEYFLKKYIPSIVVIQILSLGFYFLILNTMATSICYAVNKQMNILYLTIPCIFINVILNYILIHQGMGINGVAIGTSITHFVFNFSMLILTIRQYEESYSKLFKFLSMIYLPFVYSLFLMLSINFLFQKTFNELWSDAIYTTMEIVVFCLLYSLILIVIRNNNALHKIVESMKNSNLNKKMVRLINYNKSSRARNAT